MRTSGGFVTGNHTWEGEIVSRLGAQILSKTLASENAQVGRCISFFKRKKEGKYEDKRLFNTAHDSDYRAKGAVPPCPHCETVQVLSNKNCAMLPIADARRLKWWKKGGGKGKGPIHEYYTQSERIHSCMNKPEKKL